MSILAIVAISASLFSVAPSQAAQAAENTTRPALNVELPNVAGTTVDPTCGGLAELARIAFCVASTQAGMQAVADAYTSDFAQQGWLVGAGDENLIVYVRRRDGGGCDAFQMRAFTDESRVPAPGAPAYLAFATIPGDICSTAPAESAPAQ
ncbi:hypothetical protein [Brevundimonas sp.]|uniref:hypothetical protein n=1 Tax=Brevundimonas sp. TaxID=1871086 RepID=UPI0035AEF915